MSLRIRLRYRELDAFISKFATNISRGGMFIATRNPKEPGTEIRFELRLADDSPVISGVGEVRWVRPFDPDQPKAPCGMGIQFVSLAEGSEALIEQIVAERLRQGLGDDDAIPHANGAPPSAPAKVAPVPPAAKTAPAPPAAEASSEPGELSDDDLARALRRARELAAGAELEALSEAPALPLPPLAEAPHRLAELLGSAAAKAPARRPATEPPIADEADTAVGDPGGDDDDEL